MKAAAPGRTPHPIALIIGLGLATGLAVSQQPLLLIAAGLGVGLLAVSLRSPSWLVLGMFLGILFDRIGATGAEVANLPITASKLSVLGSIGVWGVVSWLGPSRPVRWHPVLSAMVAVVATVAACIAWSGSMENGRFTLFGLGMMTVLVGLVYAVLADRPLEPLYRSLGVAVCAALAMSVLRSGGVGEAGRASGTMGDPNEWATMVLLLGPLLLGGVAEDRHWSARPLRLALLLLVPLAVLLSGSRASVVVGALVAPGCIYLVRRHRGELLACGALAVAAAPFALSLAPTLGRLRSLVENFQGGAVVRDQSLSERMELLRQGQQLFLDNWFIGVGPGNFAEASGFISENGRLRPAHNTYLEIASEQGLVGLLPAAIFVLVVASTLYGGYRGARRERDRARILGASLGLGAVALMAATLGLLTFSMAYLVLGVTLAVVAQSRHVDTL